MRQVGHRTRHGPVSTPLICVYIIENVSRLSSPCLLSPMWHKKPTSSSKLILFLTKRYCPWSWHRGTNFRRPWSIGLNAQLFLCHGSYCVCRERFEAERADDHVLVHMHVSYAAELDFLSIKSKSNTVQSQKCAISLFEVGLEYVLCCLSNIWAHIKNRRHWLHMLEIAVICKCMKYTNWLHFLSHKGVLVVKCLPSLSNKLSSVDLRSWKIVQLVEEDKHHVGFCGLRSCKRSWPFWHGPPFDPSPFKKGKNPGKLAASLWDTILVSQHLWIVL